MTGNRSFLSDFHENTNGSVTFGDGKKGQVLGVGNLCMQGLPNLKKVLLVEGLVANLINISQMCDDHLSVQFNQKTCQVMNSHGECILTGHRSSDNCYTLSNVKTCLRADLTETELWHQKLGHLNFRDMIKITKH